MIDAPEAVDIASTSLKQLVPTFASLEPHVEEIRRSGEGDAWVITYRANNPDVGGDKVGKFGVFFPYVEKVVQVEMKSGDLLSIRNRSYE